MFRYPGAKGKLKKEICSKIEQAYSNPSNTLYVEPFFGTGAVTLELIKRGSIQSALLNDYDYSIACVWNAVLKRPKELSQLITDGNPSVDLFYTLKQFFMSPTSIYDYEIEEVAARKILLHQMSYSGLGSMAGGPIGGKLQKSKYSVNCRWSPSKIISNIDLNHKILSSINLLGGKISSLDFKEVLNSLGVSKDIICYLDPPYFEKGEDLYLISFGEKEHNYLFDFLNQIGDNVKWVLSYDNHEKIRNKYSKYMIEELSVIYSINGSNYTKEILISNFL